MRETCRLHEDFLFLPGRAAQLQAPPQEWLAHVQQCRSCREQWQADRKMASHFQGQSVPRLSGDFEARLMERLRESEAEQPVLSPPQGRARAWMAAYWAALLVGSFFFLRLPEWSMPAPSAPALSGFLMLAPLALASVLFADGVRRFAYRVVASLLN